VKRLPAFRFAVGPSPARWLRPVCIVLAVLVVRPVIGEGTQQTEPRRIPVTGACHVSPIVDNLDKSARFYQNLLGLEGIPVRSRVQDPGSYRLQLNVRDIDATLAGLSLAGGKVISSKGQPARMTFGGRPWRLAVVDVNNLFLVVQQGPPAVP
jgi:hypothetical protein